MKQSSRPKENGSASKTKGRGQDWPTQKAVVQNRAGKAPVVDDDFFNLNQPSGERHELFDNYEMFYKEQARIESSLSGSRNNISSATIQYKKATKIQDNIDDTEELEEEPVSPYKSHTQSTYQLPQQLQYVCCRRPQSRQGHQA